MRIIALAQIERTYKNNGQHAEQTARFTLTGRIEKADNKPFWCGGDCGNIQIKSSRATICKGLDIEKHVMSDPAKFYGYVVSDFSKMYVMTKTEYTEFSKKFGTITTDSNGKNGGSQKIRLKTENREMIDWLRKNS